MSDTTTGGKASFEDVAALRDRILKRMDLGGSSGDEITVWVDRAGIGMHQDGLCSAAEFKHFLGAVTLLEQERAHSDRLAEALAFVLNAPHPPRLPSGACICVRHEDAGKLVDEHAKLRSAE